MPKPLLIKFFFALALLTAALPARSQTNATYLNLTNMTVSTVGQNDLIMFGKWGGTKFVWNRCAAWDFYNNFTNSPAGSLAVSNLNAHALALGGTSNLIASTSNFLYQAIVTNTALVVTVSNRFAAITTSNAAAISATSNTLSAALASYYPTSNPAGFQTASQVSAAASAAVATYASGGITNNGAATLGSVTYSVLNLGNVGSNAPAYSATGASVTVDLSAASLQTLTLSNKQDLTLVITNLASGQNVSLVINGRGASDVINSRKIYYPAGTVLFNGGTYIQSGYSNKAVLVNFTATGPTAAAVIVSASAQQN